MEFDYDKSWVVLTRILGEKKSIMAAWTGIIDALALQVAKPYWNQLRAIDLADEQIQINDWFESLTAASAMPIHVKALWIGIVRLQDENEGEIPAI